MPLQRKKVYKKPYRKYASLRPFSKKQVKAIKKISQSSGELKEEKEIGTSASLTDTTPFTMTAGGVIPQGDGNGERVGDKIRIKDCSFRCQLECGTASGTVRVVAFQELEDEEPDMSSLSVPNDFWPDIQTSVAKYQVLYDRSFCMDPEVLSHKLINLNFPAKKLRVKYKEFASASTTLRSGGEVRIRILTNNTVINQMTVDCNSRIRYYDM